ncbi:MAG: hypothetical protein CSA45_00945 [Gammaproteobacteria bacterium]|nr:MAG: hypothetical protein CSA45_00945 [Gammaproteobacteria bacterium]
MPKEYRHHTPVSNPYASLGAKAFLLYLLPAPLIIKLIISIIMISVPKLLLTAAALFFFYSAAHLTRMTLVRYAQTEDKKRPAKVKDNRLWGAIYTTVGVLIVMIMIRKGIAATLLMPACAFVGYVMFYGLPKKSPEVPVDYDNMPRATREAIKEAYDDLSVIESLGQQLQDKDSAIKSMLDKVLNQSYGIMTLLVQAPEDAGRARRFLNVYINRIKEILQQYIKLNQHGKADDLRERILSTLTEVEKAFRTKQSQLLDDDMFKLDIQLEVLDEQIKHE